MAGKEMIKVTAEIGSATGELTPVEFQVNTGSLYTLITPELAQELGLELSLTVPVNAADNNSVQIPVGLGRIRLMGREEPVMLGAMDVPMPQLGRMTLQILGLKVNPDTESLECTEHYPPLVIGGIYADESQFGNRVSGIDRTLPDAIMTPGGKNRQ